MFPFSKHDCAGHTKYPAGGARRWQPEHSFSPLASNNLWRPSVTSHARSGDRHNQAQDGRFPRRLAPRKDWSYHVRLGFSPAAYLTHATVCGGSEPPPYKGKSFLAWLSHLSLCITIYLCTAVWFLFCSFSWGFSPPVCRRRQSPLSLLQPPTWIN